MSHLHGIQRILAETSSTTLFVVLGFGTLVSIWVCRKFSTGEFYNVTYSGQIGDIALVLCVLLGVDVLRNLDTPLPTWLGSAGAQAVLATICFVGALAALKLIGTRPIWDEQSAEVLHAFVIFPALLFLVTTTLVVTVWAGAWKMLLLEVDLISFWAVLVVIDFQTGRNNQVAYHTSTGEYFLFGW